MNHSQTKYALERAKTFYNDRRKALTEAHTIAPKLFTSKERYAALMEGRFTVDRKADLTGWRWTEAISFDGEVRGGLNQKTFNKAVGELDAAYTKLKDELILGDNEQALKLLEAFAKA